MKIVSELELPNFLLNTARIIYANTYDNRAILLLDFYYMPIPDYFRQVECTGTGYTELIRKGLSDLYKIRRQ